MPRFPVETRPSLPSSVSVALPDVTSITSEMLTAITSALGVDRSILASDDQIGQAWSSLPRLLQRMPSQQRTETIVRMCFCCFRFV